MDLYKYMCFILLTTVCYIDARYDLTEGKYTWSQATKVCTLATPSLTYNENGTTPNPGISPDTDVWLGYIETMTLFEYFGCAEKKPPNFGNTADYITEGDPGKCWSACNYVEAVAVYNNECYCLPDKKFAINKLLNDKCDLGCPSQSNIVCGGVANNNNTSDEYVSLYKTTYTGPINASDSENNICLWYDQATKHYIWGNCTDNFRMICYDDKDVWLYDGSNKFGNWTTMTIRCFKNGNGDMSGIPSRYNNTQDLNTSVKAQMWTGIIRNGVIYPITNTTNVKERKYGYINISTGHLSFTNNTSVKKRALCVNGTVTTETTSSTVETISSTGNTAKSTVETTTSTGTTATSTVETTTSTVKTTATSTVETTTSTVKTTNSTVKANTSTVQTTHDTVETSTPTVNQTSASSSNEQTSEGSSDVGTIVGATVAIIIVIIVVVVLVVLWKRGIKFPLKKARKLEKEKKQVTNMTYSFARPDNTIQGADETSFTNYAEVDVSKMTLGGEVKQNGDTNRTSCSSDEPHTYFILEKVDQGPYDKTKTTPQIHDQQTFNPYNKISIEESSNYDHIGVHVNDSKTLGLDNPYNTTTLTSSNKYNGFTNNAFNRNYESDDTYNHIDGQSCHTERNHSDNTYNTTALGHSKNDHGVTNIAFNINDECDDTYNHIGDRSAQNYPTITDNPYNTTTLGNSQTNSVNNSSFNNNNDGEDTYNHINGQVPITKPTFTDNDYATLK